MPHSSSRRGTSDTEAGDRIPKRSPDRAQSEVLGEVLLLGLVVITVSVVGVVIVSDYQDRAAAERPTVDVTGDVDSSWATVTHVGGRGIPLADLELVLRSDGSENRYALGESTVTLEGDDGDDIFEAGETANVSHAYDGTVRLLLIETADPTWTLYDREFEVVGDGGGDDPPTVEQLDVNDTSSGGNASFDVTWRAMDANGDVTGATLELRDQETGAVQDAESYSFGGTGDTGPQTDTLTNTSGAGRVYVLELSVTDAAGNTATETVVDTADSESGLQDPVVQVFDVTDTSTGQDASYEVTYNVTDNDTDLTEVTLELVDADTGAVRDTVTDTYNETGGTGDVTRSLSYTGGQSKGETFYINLTATDSNGEATERSVTDVANGEGGGGGGAQAPTIERFDVTAQSCEEYDVDWRVTDDQADLDTVTVELKRQTGNNYNTVDSADYTFGGTGEASDVVTLSANQINCGDDVRVVITATDTAGNSASDQRTP